MLESSLDLITFKNKSILLYNPYLKRISKKRKKSLKNYILSVGRLCKQKNQVIAIKAFAIGVAEMVRGAATFFSAASTLSFNAAISASF